MSEEQTGSNDLTRRSFLRVFGLAAAPLVLGGVSGCRPTDTLTKTVYADWSTDIDYDSPTKSLINKPDKDPTTSLPRLYKTKSEAVEEEIQTPQQEDENKTDKQTPEAEHSDTAQDDQEVKNGTKDKASKESKTDKELESAGKKRAQVGGNEVGKTPSKDATEEPESNGSVIAFGEVANVVLMLGGKGALWAADDEFLKAAKSLYPSSTVKSVESGLWDSYESGGKTMPNKQFKQLCARLDKLDEDKRPVYLMYDGSVGCPLTKDETALLEKRYKIVTKYFFFTSHQYLKNGMNWIKKALKGGLGFEKDPEKQYEAYWEFCDTLLDEISSCNGGAGIWRDGADRASIDFSTGKKYKGDIVDQDQLVWTLLIDSWDKSAKYTYKNYKAALKSSKGIGVSTLGYEWSPVNYYLQRGGVLNNAAARYQASGAGYGKGTFYRYVWQFDANYGQPSTLKAIGSIKGGKLTSEDDQIDRNSIGDILLRAQDGSCGLGKHGSAKFPAVIVANNDSKKRMEADRNSGSGLYSPYYLKAGATPNNDKNSAMGKQYASSKNSNMSLWKSYIGREGDVDETSCPADEAYSKNPQNAYDVLVNPHGYYSSWIDGSVESFLEAAWAYENIVAKYRSEASSLKTSYGNSTEAIVTKFYETFYGSAPRISKILSGGFAK